MCIRDRKCKAPKPPSSVVLENKENNSAAAVKRSAPKTPTKTAPVKSNTATSSVLSPSKRKAPSAPAKTADNVSEKLKKKEDADVKERQRQAEERYKGIKKDRQDALEEVRIFYKNKILICVLSNHLFLTFNNQCQIKFV